MLCENVGLDVTHHYPELLHAHFVNAGTASHLWGKAKNRNVPSRVARPSALARGSTARLRQSE